MKKLVSILLALSLIFGMFAITSVAADDELIVTVANDIHYNMLYTGRSVQKHNSISEDFFHVFPDDKMMQEGYAVIKAFLKEAGANESECLIFPGDLADTGKPEEAKIVAQMFREFEATYKKQIYVVPGNHDYFNSTVAEFKEIYAEFGYNEAIAKHDKTASYVADLPDGYRLLAIDSNTPGDGKHGINAELESWVKEQCDKAKADGKKVFAMMHHNLLEHFILASTLHSGGVVGTNKYTFADTLADGGVKYIFTGHTHDSDIASYTTESGSVIYDVVTPTLLTYQCPYRVVTFGEKTKLEARGVSAIDTADLPEGLSENALALAKSDFVEYTKKCTEVGLDSFFLTILNKNYLKSALKLQDEEMNAVLDGVLDKLCEVLRMPIAKADETEEGKSLESLAEKYDVELPKTDYKSLVDLAITFYMAHNNGDENLPAYSDEVILVSNGIAIALGYALSDVTAEEYAKVMSFLVGLADVNIPVDFFLYAGDGIKRMEGIEIYIKFILVPLVREYAVDDAPADNNVTLPGYASADAPVDSEEESKSFFEKIKDFFDKIFEAIKTIFIFLPIGK